MEAKRQPDPKRAGQLMAEGASIQSAMLEAGYAPGSAANGRRGVTAEMMAEFVQQAGKVAKVAQLIPNSEIPDVIKGVALMGAMSGEDRGAAMLKILGQDRRINHFVPDNLTGIIVVQPPPEWAGSIEERVKRMDSAPVTLPPDVTK